MRGGPAPGPCRAAPAGAEGGVGRRLPPPRGLGGGLVLAAIRVPSPARRCPAGAAGGGPVPPGPAPSPASSPGVPRARRRRRPGGRRARTGRGPRGAARSAPPLPLGPVPPGERGGRAGSWTSRLRFGGWAEGRGGGARPGGHGAGGARPPCWEPAPGGAAPSEAGGRGLPAPVLVAQLVDRLWRFGVRRLVFNATLLWDGVRRAGCGLEWPLRLWVCGGVSVGAQLSSAQRASAPGPGAAQAAQR